MKAIYISIKPKYTSKIITKEKNYEFRNYIPKEKFDTLYVYESSPNCTLKYIIEIESITKYPDLINEEGYGNNDFNKGLKTSKYAYKIKSVWELEKPISLKELRDKYSFNPPQAFAYDTKYLKLTEYLKKTKLNKIV